MDNKKTSIRNSENDEKLSIEDIDFELIPASVLQDVDKRITDWRAAGGKDNDQYIQQQLRYLKRVEKLCKQSTNQEEKHGH